ADSQQALGDALRGALEATGERFAASSGRLVEDVAARLEATTQQIGTGWSQALAAQQAQQEALVERHREALDASNAAVATRVSLLLGELEAAQARQQSALESAHALQQSTLAGQDAERFAAWRAQLEAMADAQRQQWVQAAEAAAAQQASVADALARAAADIGAQSQAHAAATIAEISTLVEAASEAPRAAAEV